MEWHETMFPRKKKARIVPSASKVMGNISWDANKGCILVYLSEGEIIIHPDGQETAKSTLW
jgi:hypothetical protein